MGPSPGNWLAAHRADLTLGKTAICIFGAKFFYGFVLSICKCPLKTGFTVCANWLLGKPEIIC